MLAKRLLPGDLRPCTSLLRGLGLSLLVACSTSPAAPDDGGTLVDASEDARADGPSSDAPASDGGSDTAADTSGYPAGPYGSAVGDTIADLGLEGYVRFGETTGLAKDVPYAATSFADLRARSPQKWAIVHVSGFT